MGQHSVGAWARAMAPRVVEMGGRAMARCHDGASPDGPMASARWPDGPSADEAVTPRPDGT
eukprot:6346925-Pyramimonas_sp.AAC.1